MHDTVFVAVRRSKRAPAGNYVAKFLGTPFPARVSKETIGFGVDGQHRHYLLTRDPEFVRGCAKTIGINEQEMFMQNVIWLKDCTPEYVIEIISAQENDKSEIKVAVSLWDQYKEFTCLCNTLLNKPLSASLTREEIMSCEFKKLKQLKNHKVQEKVSDAATSYFLSMAEIASKEYLDKVKEDGVDFPFSQRVMHTGTYYTGILSTLVKKWPSTGLPNVVPSRDEVREVASYALDEWSKYLFDTRKKILADAGAAAANVTKVLPPKTERTAKLHEIARNVFLQIYEYGPSF